MVRRWALIGLLPALLLSGVVATRVTWLSFLPPPGGGSQDRDPLLEALLDGESPSEANRAVAPETGGKSKAVLGYPVPKVPPIGASPNPNLRVALLSQFPVSRIGVAGEASCHSDDGQSRTSWDLERLDTGILGKRPSRVVCRANASGQILVNQQAYTGVVEVTRQHEGWLAINSLNLERYVASVVGAEMPSDWSEEALKAQAVAARSYALVHLIRPATSHYNLGDTTRWQAYQGLGSETGATRAAVRATRGLVLSYRGGLVESLYAASSAISQEAHGHLGASMSQSGAQELAMDGLKFNEILGRYYMGASLARLKSHG